MTVQHAHHIQRKRPCTLVNGGERSIRNWRLEGHERTVTYDRKRSSKLLISPQWHTYHYANSYTNPDSERRMLTAKPIRDIPTIAVSANNRGL